MKNINSFLTIVCLLLIVSGSTYAQGGRQIGARRFILDNNDGITANQLYLVDVSGSMGIDNSGSITGTYPNTTALLSLLAGSKTTNLRIDGGSVWGIDIVNTNNSIRTSGSNILGSAAGNVSTTININGTGNLTLNGVTAPALPSPLSNLLYLNGSSQVRQTPGGVNIITGSGTLNTVPLWTPTGFQLGNSILTQPNTSAMAITPSAGGTNVLTVNNFDATSTALKINANGGTGINVDPAGTGILVSATGIGINAQSSGSNFVGTFTNTNAALGGGLFSITGNPAFTTTWFNAALNAQSQIGPSIFSMSNAGSAAIFQTGGGGLVNSTDALQVSNSLTTGRVANFMLTNGANSANVVNISNAGTGIGVNISGGTTGIGITGSSTALTIANGNLILGSTVNNVADGGTIPNGQAVVDVASNGANAIVSTVILPAGATNGQVCYITTEDPDGVKITVGLSSVTISNAEVGRFMFINGTWRLEH